MTTQQLDEALVREKEKAEKALGCDMCKKYARCLYCFSGDEYRCAKAHDRLMLVLEQGRRKFPAYLLHEPPMEVLEGRYPALCAEKAAPCEAPKAESEENAQPAAPEETKEERLETIAQILSDYNMDSLSEERTKELMEISAMLDSSEEAENQGESSFEETSEEEEGVLSRAKSEEDGVPLLVIRRRK